MRLDVQFPSLARAYREASDDQRRGAALETCSAAVAQVGLQGSEVEAALAVLRRERAEQTDMRQKLDRLSAQLDEEYFKLDELDDEAGAEAQETLLTFRKARAAAALAFALSLDSTELHEALYEAINASDDEAEAVRVAEAALRAR